MASHLPWLDSGGGTCSDQHFLYIALARARIPTRLPFGSCFQKGRQGSRRPLLGAVRHAHATRSVSDRPRLHLVIGAYTSWTDSKIEAGKLEMEAISISLRDCLRAIFKPLGLRAGPKGARAHRGCPGGVPDPVIGDPMRVRQILSNFTDNAIKFTAGGDVMPAATRRSWP